MNESAALSHLLDRGELTRADLRELTGLSKPTISEAVRRLTDAGLVVVVGHVSAGPGPNAEVYAANPQAAYAIAVSVRDTAMTGFPALVAAVCDASGSIRDRVETPVDFDQVDPVDAIASVVEDLRSRAGIAGDPVGYVQIGVAGSYDGRTETIHHVDIPGWGRPGLIGKIEERAGIRGGGLAPAAGRARRGGRAGRGRRVARRGDGRDGYHHHPGDDGGDHLGHRRRGAARRPRRGARCRPRGADRVLAELSAPRTEEP